MFARRRSRRVRVLVALAVVVAALVPLKATAQDLEEVQQERDALERTVADVTAELDELQANVAVTRDEVATFEQREWELETRAAAISAALQDRARSSFMHRDLSTLESILSAEGPEGALERAGLMEALSRRDVATLESSTALRTQMTQNRALLKAKSAELDALEEQMVTRSAELQQRFAAVSATYVELKTRKERQVTLAQGAQNGIYACIFSGAHHFRDTWGAPRSGGRRHQGTDVFAPYGAPIYAFTNGVVQRLSNGGLGGIGLYLWGDDGVRYYYAHLAGYAPGTSVGDRVEAGELVAYNGDSGNADRGAPHVHFQVHPGGGGPLNPYPWVSAVCSRG
ncbi:MAG: peptidoglycan DD-metalloendopeptidase family protein [Actinomycetota bacterium]|nr:peptidoglycan DD-metalloendopeptidase family protein [Actinomycetota bacterium]